MNLSFHVKKGDEVVIIAGAHKESRGTVREILASTERVRVEGIGKEVKGKRQTTAANREGGFTERPASIHISNVMLASKYDARRKKGA